MTQACVEPSHQFATGARLHELDGQPDLVTPTPGFMDSLVGIDAPRLLYYVHLITTFPRLPNVFSLLVEEFA